MEIKKDIILRFGIIFFMVVIIGGAILVKVFTLQFAEGAKWEEKELEYKKEIREIDANRGDILAIDGRKLACSVPSYRIYMDTRANGLTREVFNGRVDSLAICLSHFFGDHTALTYRNRLRNARLKGYRYYNINSRRVSYTELQEIKTFPIFRLGANRGGFIIKKYNQRKLPFGELASRTIGGLYAERNKGGRFGLEKAYHDDLKGVPGLSRKMRVSGGWLEEELLEPIDGHDLITTIDVDLQDVAENALMKQLSAHNAAHGTAILMEVSTGAIKAIANLGRANSGSYIENYNYAIGEATEPGSTFKLASMIVAFEDGKIALGDSIETGKGTYKYHDRVMRDSHYGGYGTLSVKEVFEKSSNVGISRIINDNYRKDPQQFVDRLYAMGLNSTLGVEILGEGKPMIKYPGDPSWSGVSLPWMSIGYEIKQTPLQVLSFYNAVANNGKMVKPMFVKGISHHGELQKTFEPVVLNPSICSLETIEKVHEMLVGVVENGTAKNIKNDRYKIAGKTGTAQIAKGTSGYKGLGGVSYQASFVGYFPADRPLYSCVVVVTGPSNNVYYANVVAGNVFKEIADRVYAQSFDSPDLEHKVVIEVSEYLPYSKGGRRDELVKVFETVGVNVDKEMVNTEWISSVAQEYTIELKEKAFPNGLMPNLKGMGAKDAVCVLENMGLHVIINGYGKVKEQSISAGQAFSKGATVYIKLG